MMKVEVDAKSAIAAYARLKNTNVYSVLFHAMKDFVQTTPQTTPRGRMGRKGSPYALLTPEKLGGPLLGGKESQYVRIGGTIDQIAHLGPYRVKVAQYWSLTSWIAAMKMLQMSSSKAKPSRTSYLERIHRAAGTLTGENIIPEKEARRSARVESISLTDRIWFDKYPGTDQAIIAAGTAFAARRIAQDWDREVQRKWGR